VDGEVLGTEGLGFGEAPKPPILGAMNWVGAIGNFRFNAICQI
jgi:hypothetical protein